MKMKNSIWNLVWVCLLCSCNSWLDVQPYDRVAEDVVFESVKGFENALNGIINAENIIKNVASSLTSSVVL